LKCIQVYIKLVDKQLNASVYSQRKVKAFKKYMHEMFNLLNFKFNLQIEKPFVLFSKQFRLK